MLGGDVSRLNDLIADELMFVMPDGQVAGKAADLEAHRAGVLKLNRMDFRDRLIQIWGDSAVVTVEAQLEGVFHNQPFAGTFRYTRIWHQRGGKWQIVAGHAGALGGAP